MQGPRTRVRHSWLFSGVVVGTWWRRVTDCWGKVYILAYGKSFGKGGKQQTHSHPLPQSNRHTHTHTHTHTDHPAAPPHPHAIPYHAPHTHTHTHAIPYQAAHTHTHTRHSVP